MRPEDDVTRERHKVYAINAYGESSRFWYADRWSANEHARLIEEAGGSTRVVRVPPRIGHLTGIALATAIAERYEKGGRLSAWTMSNEDGSPGYYPFQPHWAPEDIWVEDACEFLPTAAVLPLFKAGLLSWPTGPDAKTWGWVRLDFNGLRPDLDLDTPEVAAPATNASIEDAGDDAALALG